MADQLATPAQVKARLKITDATDDALITELIEQTSDWIQLYTGRRFVPIAAATYVVDTPAGSVLDVPIGIRSVTSLGLAASNQPSAGGAYTAVDLADVVLGPAELSRPAGWPPTQLIVLGGLGRMTRAINGAQIVGDFGWAAVPPQIAGVTIDLVVAAYAARRNGASGVVGADESALLPSFFGRSSPQRAVLARYRAGLGIA